MANYIFETMTSADAAGFTSSDTLSFATPTLTPARVIVFNLDDTPDITTLTAGEKSLIFPSSALSGANIQFVSSFIAGSGATLKIGTSAGDNLSLNSSDGGSVIVGFAGNDDIEAIGSGEVAILSGDGNDLIFSAAGGLLDGGAGNDEITISTEDFVLALGSSGNDRILIEGEGDARVFAGEGADHVIVNGGGALSISLGDGNDIMDTSGSGGPMVIDGGAGTDSIQGGSNNDRIYGESSIGFIDDKDSVNGGDGSDYLQGNAGADTLNGGDGSDRIFGGADNDVINGDAGNDTVNGNKGADNIRGGDGNDSLRGGADGDFIQGDDGNDIIQGDAGNDTIIGGDGVDILSGGDGNDLFAFIGTQAQSLEVGDVTFTDRITDFGTGDRIDLAFAVVDVASAPGIQFTTIAAAFDYAATATVDDNEVLALTVGTDTYLFYRAGGQDGAVDSVITFNGVTTLTADSFVDTGIFEG